MARLRKGSSSKGRGLTTDVLFKILISLTACVLLTQFALLSYQHNVEPTPHFVKNTLDVTFTEKPPPLLPISAKAAAPVAQHGREDVVVYDSVLPPHLFPELPPLPPFSSIPDAARLASETLSGNPTIAGIATILNRFLQDLHVSNHQFVETAKRMTQKELQIDVYSKYFNLVTSHLLPFDEAYRGRSIFPIREDDSVFISLASFRDHLLGNTLREAFGRAADPDKLFVGAVVQNCFGVEFTCKTGAQVVGKGPHGRDQTKVSDAPPDLNGVAEFCEDKKFAKYCKAGQIRALYVNETESLGPAVARYYASKLWGGETFLMQVDAHLQFAQNWDREYIAEVRAAKSYPKAVLSSYPPGFVDPKDHSNLGGGHGARLCTCEFSTSGVESQIIRINTGASYSMKAPRPTQIPFIAAGFFFTRAEFLVDVPFDPMMPWCFMGEEIALSMRAWTSGWDIYAPRVNLINHQYRPGRMGLPKFWGSVGRLFGSPGPGFSTQLQKRVVNRVKHMVGYPECTREKLEAQGDAAVLTDLEHYNMGTVRTREDYLKFANIDVDKKHCSTITWCHQGTLE